jgi:hypothetical protein
LRLQPGHGILDRSARGEAVLLLPRSCRLDGVEIDRACVEAHVLLSGAAPGVPNLCGVFGLRFADVTPFLVTKY